MDRSRRRSFDSSFTVRYVRRPVSPSRSQSLPPSPSTRTGSRNDPLAELQESDTRRPLLVPKSTIANAPKRKWKRARVSNTGRASRTDAKPPPVPHTYPRHPLHLATLNLDVQHEIMSWLPTPSLSALMRTCRHFFEVALLPLCRRSGKEPLRNAVQLRSFLLLFLRGYDPTSRRSFIHDLYISVPADVMAADDADHLRRHGGIIPFFRFSESMWGVVMNILYYCTYLRRLRVDPGVRFHDEELLCFKLSKMPFLSELWIPFADQASEQRWGELFDLPLHTLTLEPHMGPDYPECLLSVAFFARQVVDLRLPDFHGWDSMLELGVRFPHVRRLTSGYPGSAAHKFPEALRDTFPNVVHLVLTGSAFFNADPQGEAVVPMDIEEARRANGRQWTLHPPQWPSLASISCDHPCTFYALALPVKIPALSIMYEDPRDTVTVRRAKAVIGDLRPSCLELRLCMTEHSCRVTVASDDDADAASCPELDILEGDLTRPSTIRSCVLTILHDYYSGDDEWRVAKHSDVVGMLLKALSKLQITHVLNKYCSPHLLQHDAEELLGSDIPGDDQQAHRATILANGHVDAQRLASASRTLRWFGIYAEGDVLKSWEIECLQEPKESTSDATAVLQEVVESRAWKILQEQGMEEFATRKIPPWHPPGPPGKTGPCFWGAGAPPQ